MTYTTEKQNQFPESQSLIALENHAASLAWEAGQLLLQSFHKDHKIEYKDGSMHDPVTDQDKRAEELIKNGIRSKYPEHGIIAEETPENENYPEPVSDFLWVVDPLDGTTNFIHKYPVFSVSIGILYKGTPVAGALFIPSPVSNNGTIYRAHRNGGAFANKLPIRVDPSAKLSTEKLVCLPSFLWKRFHLGKQLRRSIGQTRYTGSIAYEIALVSSGIVQYAAFTSPRIWDIAAGVLILKEAGGEILTQGNNNHWEPLDNFLNPNFSTPEINTTLRNWTTSIVIGNRQVSELVVRNLHPRNPIMRILGIKTSKIS